MTESKAEKTDGKNWFSRMFSGKDNSPADENSVVENTIVENSVVENTIVENSGTPASSQHAQLEGLMAAKPSGDIPDALPNSDPTLTPNPDSEKQGVPDTPDPSLVGQEQSWFDRLSAGLKKSASALSDGITGIFTKGKLDDDTLEELEDLLITTDLGVSVAARVTQALAKGRYDKEIAPAEIKSVLCEEIEKIVAPVAKPLVIDRGHKPHILLMTGVNGAGKTTTIGKLAKQFKAAGKTVMLAAADTFRAAAIEQLKVWGERSGVPVIAKTQGSDAAAVAFEALNAALESNIDVLIIDTAGRLQNRDELMAELAKIVRVINKRIDGAPHDTLIVLDATTGQNALMQVEAFQKAAAVTGLIMTKLDGSARGGVLVACADKFGLPIHAIGVGEGIEDLQAFNPKDYAKGLLGMVD